MPMSSPHITRMLGLPLGMLCPFDFTPFTQPCGSTLWGCVVGRGRMGVLPEKIQNSRIRSVHRLEGRTLWARGGEHVRQSSGRRLAYRRVSHESVTELRVRCVDCTERCC